MSFGRNIICEYFYGDKWGDALGESDGGSGRALDADPPKKAGYSPLQSGDKNTGMCIGKLLLMH